MLVLVPISEVQSLSKPSDYSIDNLQNAGVRIDEAPSTFGENIETVLPLVESIEDEAAYNELKHSILPKENKDKINDTQDSKK